MYTVSSWNIFRVNCIQPENGRVKVRTVESLLKRLPGISPDDYTTIAASIRTLLKGTKKLKKVIHLSKEEQHMEVADEVPNAEPMANEQVMA